MDTDKLETIRKRAEDAQSEVAGMGNGGYINLVMYKRDMALFAGDVLVLMAENEQLQARLATACRVEAGDKVGFDHAVLDQLGELDALKDEIGLLKQTILDNENYFMDLRAELAVVRAAAARLASALRETEWVMVSHEYSYCGWCRGAEPGPEPKRWGYVSDENFEWARDVWLARGHKPDCARQAALAAHDALTPPEQET